MALSGDTLLEEVSLRYWLWESKALLNFKSAFSVSCTLTSETMNQNRSLLPESALAEVFVTAAEMKLVSNLTPIKKCGLFSNSLNVIGPVDCLD